MPYDFPAYDKEITDRARLLKEPYYCRKINLDVASGLTNEERDGLMAVENWKGIQKMKAAMIALVVALVAIVTTSTISWKQRIVTAIVAAAIAVAVSVFVPGCMSTTSIDGKEYSWRLDILAPIGATVPKPEWESANPVIIYANGQPTTQPATGKIFQGSIGESSKTPVKTGN